MSPHVQIAPYDPDWPVRFALLAAQLRTALGAAALRIDHIGSTAVPGLDAKPIVDIQISVVELEPLSAYGAGLSQLGFVHRVDNPDLTKRYFREAPGTPRTHIHVRCAGGFAEQFSLLFRDYLRAHAHEAIHYAKGKRELALQFAENREAYTDAKGPFIWDMMQRANGWSQHTGWQPGPSDG